MAHRPVDKVRQSVSTVERNSTPVSGRLAAFSTHPVGSGDRGRLVFLFGVLCYAVIDFWLLRWVPLGLDDGQFWHLFYNTYIELFYHHELAHWFPYGFY